MFRSQCPCYQEEILPAGAKIFGLTAGLPQGEALAFASHTAAITVSRMGAMPSLPTVEEVQQLLVERDYQGFDPAELDALKQ